MPQPISRPPSKTRTPLVVTEGTGPQLARATSAATAQGPAFIPGATATLQIIGVDAAPFSFVSGGSTLGKLVTFPNLPYRDNTVNPLTVNSSASQPLTIAPKDHLIFIAFLQSLSGPAGSVIGVTPQALDDDGVTAVGPFLGANTFKTFQAQISSSNSTPGGVSGVVLGMLLLSVG